MSDKASTLSGKLLLFHAGIELALPLSDVSEVLPFVQLARPPASPDVVAGIANVAGTAVTVIRLAPLLGLDIPDPDSRWHMIRLAGSGTPVALLVERALMVVESRALEFAPVSEDATFNGLVKGELLRNGEVVAHLLDADKVLTAEEAQRLESFARLAQERLDGLEVA